MKSRRVTIREYDKRVSRGESMCMACHSFRLSPDCVNLEIADKVSLLYCNKCTQIIKPLTSKLIANIRKEELKHEPKRSDPVQGSQQVRRSPRQVCLGDRVAD